MYVSGFLYCQDLSHISNIQLYNISLIIQTLDYMDIDSRDNQEYRYFSMVPVCLDNRRSTVFHFMMLDVQNWTHPWPVAWRWSADLALFS